VFAFVFLALLLLPLGLRPISTAASHLRMLGATHLSVAHLHLLLMLAAHTHHLLLVMLRIHLLLAMHHLLIHAVLALTGACLVGSLVVHPDLVSANVLIVAVKILSLVFISSVLNPTFFAVFFTAHSRSLALMFSEVSRSVFAPTFLAVLFTAHSRSLTLMFAKLVASSCSCRTACGPDFLSAPAFGLVE